MAEYDRDVLKLCDLKEGMEINFSDFVQIVQKQILSAGRRAEICRSAGGDEICRNKRSRWQEEIKKAMFRRVGALLLVSKEGTPLGFTWGQRGSSILPI